MKSGLVSKRASVRYCWRPFCLSIVCETDRNSFGAGSDVLAERSATKRRAGDMRPSKCRQGHASSAYGIAEKIFCGQYILTTCFGRLGLRI